METEAKIYWTIRNSGDSWGGSISTSLTPPPDLAIVHDVFYISIIRKYIPDLNHVISHENREVSKSFTNEESHITILGRKVHTLKNREVSLVLV